MQESFTTQGKLDISGTCFFQFYERKELKVHTLRYQTYGQAAIALKETGVDSIHIISGWLNIFPPNAENSNHQPLLNITKAICISESSQTTNHTPVQSAVQTNENNNSNGKSEIYSTDRILVSTATNNGKHEKDFDDIPF